MQSKKYNASFQGLRGIAILLIVISHCSFGINAYGSNTTMYCGGLGVSIFIMLSGYLTLYQHYDNNTELKFKEFFFEKIKKFYPLHLLTLIVALPFLLISIKTIGKSQAILIFISNLTLVQTWIPIENFYFSLNAVSWYLSITMFFIVMTPVTIKCFRKISMLQVGILTLLLIAFEFIWTFLVGDYPEAHWLIYVFPVTRFVDFLIGGGVYLLTKDVKQKNKRNDFLLYISMIICLCFLVISSNQKNEIFSVVSWTIPVIAIIALTGREVFSFRFSFTLFNNRFIQFFGRISFELFLIHQLVIRYVRIIFSLLGIKSEKIFVDCMAIILAVICTVLYRKVFAAIKKIARTRKKEDCS